MSRLLRLPVMLAALVVVACSNDETGPDNVLVGRFGDPVMHAELLAVHGGAELMLACGAYFTSSEPIELGSSLEFSRTGRWHAQPFGVPVPPRAATITGSLAGEIVHLTMTVDGGGDDPPSYSLRRDASGALDQIACALTSGAE